MTVLTNKPEVELRVAGSSSPTAKDELTVSTAPLTAPINQQNKNKEGYDKEVPTSNSTLSSATSLEHANKALNADQHVEATLSADPAIPSSCSSPYQAFLFSSEWLGSTEISRSSSHGGGGDDTDSVVSGGYFEPGDLDSSNWLKAIRMDGPTFGFAIVALATALVHPVLFVAGALTAFGTLHAVGAGYEYCNGKNAASESAASWEHCLLTICHKDLPEDGPKELEGSQPELEGVDDNKNNSLLLASPPLAEATNTDTATTKEDAPSDEQAIVPITVEEEEEEPTPQPAKTVPVEKTSRHPPSTRRVEAAYPALNNLVVKDVPFPGLHAIEFFRVFFADDAPYNFMELQKQRGDLDIVYGQWKDLGPDDPAVLHDGRKGDTKISMKPANSGAEALNALLSESDVAFQGRVLTFKAKTNNFIGPLYATTRKTQRVLLYHKTCIVMESRTDLTDIPFCDRFYVLERWIIRAQKVKDASGKSKYVSTLTATSQVVFTGSCQFSSQIKSKSVSTIKELVTCWCTMAKEALKLTEQRKSLRLKNESEHECCDTDQEEESVSNNKKSMRSIVKEEDVSKENVPPPPADEGEGIEMTWPKKEDVVMALTPLTPAPLTRHKLKHSDSVPLPAPKKHKLQGFRRSVSNLWNKR